jgi:hypothetical protein
LALSKIAIVNLVLCRYSAGEFRTLASAYAVSDCIESNGYPPNFPAFVKSFKEIAGLAFLCTGSKPIPCWGRHNNVKENKNGYR